MNKNQLIDEIVSRTDITKSRARFVIDETIAALSASLANGNDVNLAGFGSLRVKTMAARKGRNPQTGESIDIPEKQVVRFKAASALKEKVDG